MKEIAGAYKKKHHSILINENNEIVANTQEKGLIWKKYISNLFSDNRLSINKELNNSKLTGPPITKEEIKKVIQEAKENKTVGPDEIPVELLKLSDKEGIAVLHNIFNKIYNTGEYPAQWLTSTFIAIPKKNNAYKCDDHRLIRSHLMSHTLKLFLKILHKRIFRKCEVSIGNTQFGFRRRLGTREALVATQVLVQNCHDQRKDICLCFIDYEKAFDKVQHCKLIKILRNLDINQKDINCIESCIGIEQHKVDGKLTNMVMIQKGVRQECILSPLLFNLYSENIFQEALGVEGGIKVNGV